MQCAPSPTGALWPVDAKDYGDGWPKPNPDRAEWAGIQTLKQVWTDTQQFLYQPEDAVQEQQRINNKAERRRLWSTDHAGSDQQTAIQETFDQAFGVVRELIRDASRALQNVYQWELESDQRRLQSVLTYLVYPNSNFTDQYDAGHADIVLSVLMDLLESLIPPWSNGEGIGPPTTSPNIASQSFAPIRAHYKEWYAKLRDLADRFIGCVATVGGTLPTTRLAARKQHFVDRDKAMDETNDLKEEQHRRKRLLWHIQRDHSYVKDLMGTPWNVTYNNMSNGSCGYNSFVAGVGLNGVNPDPVYGLKEGGAEATQKVVRRKSIDWLQGKGLSRDVTNAHWVRVAQMTEAWDAEQDAGEGGRRRKTWVQESETRMSEGHWATTEDFVAMAAAFKRRIHLYLIVNDNEQQPADAKPVIKYFQHMQSFGDVEHRPVCIAWCKANTDKDKWGYMRGVPSEERNRTENHFAVILSASEPPQTPHMNGWGEGNLPYEGDEDAAPFSAPRQKGVPNVPARTRTTRAISAGEKATIYKFFGDFDERKEQEAKRTRVRKARATLESRRNAERTAGDGADMMALALDVSAAEAELKAANEALQGGQTFEEAEEEAKKKIAALAEYKRKKAEAEAAAKAAADAAASDPPPTQGGGEQSAEIREATRRRMREQVVERFKAHAKQQLGRAVQLMDLGKGREMIVGSDDGITSMIGHGRAQEQFLKYFGGEYANGVPPMPPLEARDGEQIWDTFMDWLENEFAKLKMKYGSRMTYGELGYPDTEKPEDLERWGDKVLVWGANAQNWTGADNDDLTEWAGQAKAIRKHHPLEVGIISTPLRGLPPEAGAAPKPTLPPPPPKPPLQRPPNVPFDQRFPWAHKSDAELNGPWKKAGDVKDTDAKRALDSMMLAWSNMNSNAEPSDKDKDALAVTLWRLTQEHREQKWEEDRRRRDAEKRDKGGGGGEGSNGRIEDVEGSSDDEEAARYNYTVRRLGPVQINFVQRKLKDAHEAFVKHSSNRLNYGKIALMNVPDPNAIGADSDDEVGPAQPQTKAATANYAKGYEELKDWQGTYNGNIIGKWEKEVRPKFKRPTYDGSNIGKAQLVVKHLIVDVFKNWVKAVSWWINFKGEIAYAHKGEEGFSGEFQTLRNMLREWIATLPKAPKTENRQLHITELVWAFMEGAKGVLDEAILGDYTEEYLGYGDGKSVNTKHSRRLLVYLNETDETATEECAPVETGKSGERRALQRTIDDANALVAKLEASERGDTENVIKPLQKVAQKAKNAADDDKEDVDADTKAKETLYKTWMASLKWLFANDLPTHVGKAEARAKALLSDMETMGYDDATVPEYGALQTLYDNPSSRRAAGDDNGILAFWELLRAYDRAFCAVYGDGADVEAFKATFEDTKMAE